MKAHANNNDGIAAIAIGSGSEAQKDKSIAIGYGALAQNNGASGGIAIGSSASQENITTRTTAAQGNDIAFGVGAQTINRNMNGHNGGAIAIGHLSYSNGNQDVAIGDNAKTGRTGTEGEGYVAIGANSFSNVGPGVVGYDFKTNGSHNIQTNEDAAAWKSTNGAVSVGNVSDSDHTKWITRQITGVAAGFADTDAVNVAQLRAAITNTGTSGDGVHYYSVLSDEKGDGSNYDNKGAKGKNSLAAGVSASTTEKAENAVAIGYKAKAEGKGATVIGKNAKATGQYATAFGGLETTDEKGNVVNIINTASGASSTAFGQGAQAKGAASLAFGHNTVAGADDGSGQQSVAFGEDTQALGGRSLAFGEKTVAKYNDSVAFGNDTRASSTGATAFGNRTRALAQYSTAWGNATVAADEESTAWGSDTIAGAKLDDNGAVTNIYTYKNNPDDKDEPLKTATEKMDVHGNLVYIQPNGKTAGIKQMKIDTGGELHDYVVLDGQDGNTYVRDYQGSLWKVNVDANGQVTVDTTAGTNGKVYNGNGTNKTSLAKTTVNNKEVDITPDSVLKKAHEGTNGYDIDGYKDATAFGYSTEASGDYATAFGNDTQAKATGATAFGNKSQATGRYATAWGGSKVVKNKDGTISEIGTGTLASGDNATAFGLSTTASGTQATAFGLSTTASGDNATAFGENSTASGEAATAFGISSNASGKNSLAALGGTASTENAIAVGKATEATNTNTLAVGNNAKATGEQSVAIGFGIQENDANGNLYSVTQTEASGESAIAIGTDTKATNQHSLAIGSHTDATADSTVAIGYDTHAAAASSIAIGSGSKANSGYTIAIGLSALAGPDTATTTTEGSKSLAVGYFAQATKENNIALGYYAQAMNAKNATAVGTSANAETEGSVALGYGSDATRASGNIENGVRKDAYLKPTTVSTDKASVWTSTAGAVSVGKTDATNPSRNITRQITNVAAGSDDTDAVNVAQLKAAQPTVTSNDHSVTINPTTDSTDYHKNYDLKIATATLSQDKTTGDKPVETGKVTVTNPTYAGSDGKLVTNENAYVTGKSVADAINNSGFNLLASKSEGDVTGSANTLIHPGDTVTIDAGKNISLTQNKGKITIATKDNLNLGSADTKDDKQQDVPGVNGSVTVNGKNGSSVAINGADGSIDLTSSNGADGTSTSIKMSTIMSDSTLNDDKNIKTTSGEGEQQTTTTQAPRIQYKNGNTTYEVATMDDGLKIGANAAAKEKAANPVSNKLNSTINIMGSTAKEKHTYTDDNLTTTVEQDEYGNTTVKVLMDKDLTGNSVTVGKDGKDGTDGKEGSIGIAGKDGKAGTDGKQGVTTTIIKTEKGQNGKDGEIGKQGAPGVDGKDITRIVYKNGQDGENGQGGKHVVATLDDGLNFVGDDSKAKPVAKKLNDTLQIRGDGTYNEKNNTVADDGNIKTSVDNGAVKVSLSDKINLHQDGYVTVGGSKNGDAADGNDPIVIKNFGAGDLTVTGTDKYGKTPQSEAGDYVTGLDNKNWDVDHPTYVSGRAATEDQLKAISDTIKTNAKTAAGQHTAVTVNDKDSETTAPVGTDGKYSSNYGSYSDSSKGNLLIAAKTEDGQTTYNIKLNDQLAIGKNGTDGKDGKDGKVTVETSKGTTVVIGHDGEPGKDGKDGISVKGQDGKDGVTFSVTNGKDGKDGSEGHIGLTGPAGKDGKDASADIHVKNGQVGVDGTDGHGGKNGMDRVVYEDHNGTPHEVATMDDGMKYGDDFGNTAKVKLNHQLDIVGDINAGKKDGDKKATKDDLSDGNIGIIATDTTYNADGTVKENGRMTVKLAKELKGLNSSSYATTTKIDGKDVISKTVVDGTGLKIENGPSITNTGIDGGKHQITNVASGKDGKMYDTTVEGHKNWNNAANIGDVTNIAKSAADGVQAKSGKNITVDANNKVNLNDNITLGDDKDKTKQVSINGNGAKITAGDGNNKVTVDGSKGQIVAGGDNGVKIGNIEAGDSSLTIYDKDGKATKDTDKAGKYVTGLDNKTWNKDGSYVSGRAATEDQLHQLESSFNTKVEAVEQHHTEVTVNGGDKPEKADGSYTKGNLQLAQTTQDGKNIYDLKLSDNLSLGTIGKDGAKGTDGSIGLKGADGKSSIGLNGKDGISVIGADGKNGVSITGSNGLDGKNGIDGKIAIGTPGKDGQPGKDAISISGKDGIGHIGLTGQKGADGKDGIFNDLSTILGTATLDPAKNEQSKSKDTVSADDKSSRIQYQTTVTDKDGKTKTVITHEVATMDDGMKYAGDFGDGASVKLNKTVNIKGNIAKGKTKDDFVDGNIAVVANKNGEDGELLIKLNKDLTGLNSATYTTSTKNGDVTTTSKTVVDGTGLKIENGPSITNTGIDGGKHQITNVASGKDGNMYDTTVKGQENWNNAANIGDVTNIAKSAADGVQAKSGKNITVDANNKVNLNDNITLGDDKDKTKQVSINGNGAKITAGDGDNKVTVDGSKGQIVAGGDNGVKIGKIADGDSSLTIYDKEGKATGKTDKAGKYVTNLDNKTWNKDGSYVSGRAATEDQLYQVESNVNKQIADVNTKIDTVDKHHTEVTVNGGTAAKADGSYTDGNLQLKQTTGKDGQKVYDLKLNDQLKVGQKGEAGKAGKDGNVTVETKGGTTVVIGHDGKDGKDGRDGLFVIGKDGKDGKSGVSITGPNGVAGRDGVDGKVGIAGKDGRDAVSIAGRDGVGHIGLTGPKGADGKDGQNASADIHVKNGQVGVDGTDGHGGKDGMDRVVYEDHNGTPHEVATMDDGMKYGDDFGNTAKVKLNHQLDIVGDINAGKKDGDKKATKDDLSDGNIGIIATDTTYNEDGTVKENGKMTVKLAKDLKGLNSIESNSVTTGNTTINNGGLTIKTGDENRNITVQDGNINMGSNQIHNVAPGQAPGDAVNVSQLNATNYAVNKLGTRVNRVGAGAAALAALHPLDFDPDDKWDFAAGYGNYRGANAAAVGAYYRPNEDTMFSVGGSFGSGENMVNAGVSIKLGQGNHVSTSRVAMAKEMKAMRQHMAEQDALIAKLQSMHGIAVDPAKSTLFPDVAENHWAYQYVTTLAKKGILEGYPDGEFKGDRMMTRYEFAAIVYRIVESGVGSTDPELSKLVKEFSPELQYIRIDTVQKDRNGKPTIERVRVISDAK